MTRPIPWLASFFLVALTLCQASPALADDNCVQHTFKTECEVDGKVQPCDHNALEPGRRYRLVVELDADAQLYVFTGVEGTSASVERHAEKAGRITLPADGWREVGDTPRRVDVLAHSDKVPSFDELVGAKLTWQDVENKMKPVVVAYLEEFGLCRAEIEDEEDKDDSTREDSTREEERKSKSEETGKRRRTKKKDTKKPPAKSGGGDSGVHVEPELLD